MRALSLIAGLFLLPLFSGCQKRQSAEDPQEIINAFLNPEPDPAPGATFDLMNLNGFFVFRSGGVTGTASHGVILHIEDAMAEMSAFGVHGFHTCPERQMLVQEDGQHYRLAASEHCPEIWFKSVCRRSDDYFCIDTNLEAEPDSETYFSPTSMSFVSQKPESVGLLLYGWPDKAKKYLAPHTSASIFVEPAAEAVDAIQASFRDFFRSRRAVLSTELVQDFFLNGGEQRLFMSGEVNKDPALTFTFENSSAPDSTLCEITLKEKSLSDLSRKILAVELHLPRRAGGKYLTSLPADLSKAPEQWLSDTKTPENRVSFSFSTSANDESGLFSERLGLRCRKLPLQELISVSDVQAALGPHVTFTE